MQGRNLDRLSGGATNDSCAQSARKFFKLINIYEWRHITFFYDNNYMCIWYLCNPHFMGLILATISKFQNKHKYKLLSIASYVIL